MRTVSRALVILGLLIGFGISAMATDITWTLNNVAFNDGNVATGSFTTSSDLSTVDSVSIVVSGPDSARDFTAVAVNAFYLTDPLFPGPEIEISNLGFSVFTNLYFASPLTSAGGVTDFTSGYDCPGCGVLVLGNSPSVTGVPGGAVPEPAAVLLLGTGVGLFGTLRRKLFSAS